MTKKKGTKETAVDVVRSKMFSLLPGGESNPGLPRDRRGYSPLYYRGLG